MPWCSGRGWGWAPGYRRGAITLTDRGMSDDKLVCSDQPSPRRNASVCCVFSISMRNARDCSIPGGAARNACEGWCEASEALARARLRDATWRGRRSSSDGARTRVRKLDRMRNGSAGPILASYVNAKPEPRSSGPQCH